MAWAYGIVSHGGMDRRDFLRNAALSACAAGSPTWLAGASAQQRPTRQIDLNIDSGQRLGPIPADFMGLGYEISSVASRKPRRSRSPVSLITVLFGAETAVESGAKEE